MSLEPNHTFLTCSYKLWVGNSVTIKNMTLVPPPSSPEFFFDIETLVLFLLNLFFISGIILFLKVQHCEIIAQRAPHLVKVTMLCAILFTNFHILRVCQQQAVYANIPCFVEVWTLFLVFPTWLMTYYLRAIFVVSKYSMNEAMVRHSIPKPSFLSFGYLKRTRSFLLNAKQRFLKGKGDTKGTLDSSFHSSDSIWGATGNDRQGASEGTDDVPQMNIKSRLSQRQLLQMLGIFVLGLVIILAVVHANYDQISISPPTYPQYLMATSNYLQFYDDLNQLDFLSHPLLQCSVGCHSIYEALSPYTLPFYLFVFITFPYLFYLMSKVKDSLYIRQEIMLYLGIMIPMFLLFIVSSKITTENSMQPLQSNLAFSLLEAFTRIIRPTLGIWSFLVTVLVPSFKSYWRLHHRIQVEFNLECYSNLFLAKDGTFDHFKVFLTSQLCIENGLFAEKFLKVISMMAPNMNDTSPELISSFLQQHYNISPEVPLCIQKRVEVIYDQFVKVNSPYELNLLGYTRVSIEKEISAGVYHPFILAEAWKEIYYLMFENSYKEYVRHVANMRQPPFEATHFQN